MIESMQWLATLIAEHSSFTYIIIFLGAAFGGEPAVIALSFLAAQGIFPAVPFIFTSFLGVLFSDCLYFFLGKTTFVRKLIEHRYAAGTIAAIMEAIERLSRGRHVAAFILAKFVIGTRAVIIMYVSKTGITFGYFLRHNLLAIMAWLTLVIAIGYLAGIGYSYVSGVLENVYAGVGFLFLVLIILIIVQTRLKRAFMKEERKIEQEKPARPHNEGAGGDMI